MQSVTFATKSSCTFELAHSDAMSLSLDLRWAVEKGDGPEVERLLVEGVSVHESFMVRPLSHHHCEERVDQNRVVVCVCAVSDQSFYGL